MWIKRPTKDPFPAWLSHPVYIPPCHWWTWHGSMEWKLPGLSCEHWICVHQPVIACIVIVYNSIWGNLQGTGSKREWNCKKSFTCQLAAPITVLQNKHCTGRQCTNMSRWKLKPNHDHNVGQWNKMGRAGLCNSSKQTDRQQQQATADKLSVFNLQIIIMLLNTE